MREILFRGKRLDNGEWVYGDCRATENCIAVPCDIRHFGIGYDVYPVVPDTIGQYTGLKDRNGKRIFEGDILMLSDRKSHSEDVVVEHGLYGWTFYNPKTATFYSDGSHTYAAVENCRFMFGTGILIGNIHDNPDLLK